MSFLKGAVEEEGEKPVAAHAHDKRRVVTNLCGTHVLSLWNPGLVGLFVF